MTKLSARQVFSPLTKFAGWSVVAVLAASIGCSGAQKPTAANPAAASGNLTAAPSVDRTRCKSSGKQVIEADTDFDKKADVWKYYVPNAQGSQIMTCRQVDLNHDGKVDITYYFDDTGAQTNLDEVDLDFDGRIDMATYYASGRRVREEMDTNYDNQPDVWKIYEEDRLVRIERDSDFNTRVDQWEYYESGKLDRIGYDTSGSGRVDKWDRAPEGIDDATEAATGAAQSQLQASAKPTTATPGAAESTAPAPTSPAPTSPGSTSAPAGASPPPSAPIK